MIALALTLALAQGPRAGDTPRADDDAGSTPLVVDAAVGAVAGGVASWVALIGGVTSLTAARCKVAGQCEAYGDIIKVYQLPVAAAGMLLGAVAGGMVSTIPPDPSSAASAAKRAASARARTDVDDAWDE